MLLKRLDEFNEHIIRTIEIVAEFRHEPQRN